MIEQLRMQEVSQIILSMPEGAIVKNKHFEVGEPVMVINNPALSNLSFVSRPVGVNDAQGHIGTAGITNNIDFVINEGSVLYALWSYIYGFNDEEPGETKIKGNEYLTADSEGKITLSAIPELNPGIDRFYLYKSSDNINTLLPHATYAFETDKEDNLTGVIQIDEAREGDVYFVTYTYKVDATTISNIKQIHNNIFCAMDIYIDAVDLKNDDKHTVYIHCDKVQVDTDMVLSINDSSKASFTPIRIKSIAEGGELNKNIATIVVV
jgi:hypothetical protein